MIVTQISVTTLEWYERVNFKYGMLWWKGNLVAELPHVSELLTQEGVPVVAYTIDSIQADKLTISLLGVQRPATLTISGTLRGEPYEVARKLTVVPGPYDEVKYDINLPVTFSYAPMPPQMGPPLPAFLGIYWPWYRRTK